MGAFGWFRAFAYHGTPAVSPRSRLAIYERRASLLWDRPELIEIGRIFFQGTVPAMTSANASTFVYVGSSDSQDVTVFNLLADGGLIPTETIAVPGPGKPGGSLPMAISPDKKWLFAAVRNGPYSLVTFAIDAQSGRLTLVGSGPLADSMCYITTDRGGRFILAASYGGNKITLSPLNADGVVADTQQIVETQPNAHCVIVDPSNRFVLNTSLGGDVVHQHKFDASTGILAPNDPATIAVKAKAGPRHLIFSPDQRFAYLVNELDGTIYVFPYDSTIGVLRKEIQVASVLPRGFTGTPWAGDIHVTPNGRFLYASERTSSTLAAFTINKPNGVLKAVGSYLTEEQPRAFAVDPAGKYVLAAGQLSNSLTVHAIDQESGALNKLNEYPVGRNPNWIEIVTL
jgi:6-phosphogluconolactonase